VHTSCQRRGFTYPENKRISIEGQGGSFVVLQSSAYLVQDIGFHAKFDAEVSMFWSKLKYENLSKSSQEVSPFVEVSGAGATFTTSGSPIASPRPATLENASISTISARIEELL
jgi:hypothetical protein